MNFKEKFKQYRIENKLTQKEFANRLDISRTGVADIESGRIKGTVKLMNKLAEVTGKPISYWMDTESEANYKTYESLDILIDAMIDSGMIGEDGKVGDRESKLILAVLEKEILLKIKRKKEQS
jgi:transcriptional regulator with XRE-family HTH domain